MDRLRELEAKGVYNLSPEELNELEVLVKIEIAKFPEKFKVTVDNACEAIRNILSRG